MNLVEVYDDANNVNCVGSEMKRYIPSLEDNDLEEFVIYKGKLMYIGSNESRSQIANSLGIESGSETTKDIVKVTDIVNTICSSITPPADDTEETPSGCIGTRLYDKNNQNSTNWRLVIEYSNSNQEKARYGSGWFLLKSGTILEDGTEIKNDYVINYKTNEMALLSNYKEWTLSSQLAVTDSIILNIDAKNLSDGTWSGVERNGDVIYYGAKSALYFDGDGDSLKVMKPGDFCNGFTFEFYFNADTYSAIGSHCDRYTGFFYRLGSSSSTSMGKMMRFGTNENRIAYRFGCLDSVELNGDGFFMRSDGWGYQTSSDNLLKIKEDTYLTVVYDRNTNPNDKLSFYINGEYIGSTPYNKQIYNWGLEQWNNDESPFFVGVCPFDNLNELHYYQGFVYSCRLYNRTLIKEEVKDNYDSTVQFRNSGL